ncbi:MAG: flavoprotein, partial [Oscillospiraceae bacterium]
MNQFGKKTIVLGITGGIAAYKMANFSHMLVKAGYDVHVIMTKNACNFITPLTFESLTSNPVILDTFERSGTYEIQHIALA